MAPLVADTTLDPHTRAVVLALAADVGDGLGTPRAELARRSLDLFKQVGADADGAALCTALLYLAFARMEAGEGIAFDVLRRIGELQRDLPYVVSSNRAETVLACWYKDVEDLDRSRTALRAAIGATADRGEDSMLPSLYGHLALTEIWAGNLPDAREALDRGKPLVPEGATTPVALSAADALLILLTGNVANTRPVVEKWPDGPSLITNIKGLAALLDGDDEAAAGLLGPAYAKARDAGVREPGRRGRLEGNLGQALVSLGRLDEARAVADELLEIGEAAGRPTLVGIGRRIEGLALAAAGDLNAAVVSLEAAVAAHRTSPFRVELGRSLLALGQIQRRRKAEDRGTPSIGRSPELLRDDRRRTFIDLVRAELGKGRRGGDGSDAAALTPTERQVADLVIGRADQPRGRRPPVHQRAHGRDAPRGHLPEARNTFPKRARRRGGRARRVRPTTLWPALLVPNASPPYRRRPCLECVGHDFVRGDAVNGRGGHGGICPARPWSAGRSPSPRRE